MKVKGFITAAGVGKRFGALTRRMNKCLFRVEGKPLIGHIVEKLKQAGIEDIVIASGYQDGLLHKALDGEVRFVFNPFYRVSGILSSFWQVRPFLERSAFLFTTSDHFFHSSVLEDCLDSESDLQIVVQRKKRYTREDAKVIIRGRNVLDLGKDIPVEEADGEFGGMVYFSSKASAFFFRELELYLKQGAVEGYVMDVLKSLREKHGFRIAYCVCSENMRMEVDSVPDLIQARHMAKNFKKGETP